MNLKYQLAQMRGELAAAKAENKELREVIERAGLTLLEGEFTQRDGSISSFYIDGSEVRR